MVPSLIEKCLLSCVNRNTAAERRKQAIQESKFLGGDMEHTHLVKGLDFALLQKVNCFFFFTSCLVLTAVNPLNTNREN